MKQLFFPYFKGTTTVAISLLMLFTVTKTNAQWVELGTNGGAIFNRVGILYDIQTIATDAGGNVYAGGYFSDANGNKYVAKWDGTAWSELGGANGAFNSIIYSITTDAGGNVYAGGYFSDSNGNPYIAKWNGTAWSELGGTSGSFNNGIQTIATDAGGNVYTSGFFTDTNFKHYVAKWDGTAWSELGGANGAFNDDIQTIATGAGGNVYAGGYFYDANHNPYVAKWDNTGWSELGGTKGSFNSYISSVATDAVGNVYTGGFFVDTNGYNYVARWNSTEWSELGGASGGFNNIIETIHTDVVGNVYTGGYFTDAHGNHYVAEYIQNVLPVTLVNITATKEKTGVAISWQTAIETNSNYFTVQRGSNGNSFRDIGTVKAAGSGANSYQFMDDHSANGTNYYRLKMVNNDGSFTYSSVRTVNETISFSANFYSNPVQNHLNLIFNSYRAQTVQMQIVNSEGKVITTQQIQVAAGASTQNISTASLSNGAYYIRLVSEEGQTKLKFVKER